MKIHRLASIYTPQDKLSRQMSPFQESITQAATPIDISIRFQIDATGPRSLANDQLTPRLTVTTEEFFFWFTSQDGYNAPSSHEELNFSLMNAVPTPRQRRVKRGNDGYFKYIRMEAKSQL